MDLERPAVLKLSEVRFEGPDPVQIPAVTEWQPIGERGQNYVVYERPSVRSDSKSGSNSLEPVYIPGVGEIF
jgi:hypothetical protein